MRTTITAQTGMAATQLPARGADMVERTAVRLFCRAQRWTCRPFSRSFPDLHRSRP
jgi:transposase-like protein